MKHRHLTHDDFTTAAIEDILARGRMPDWVPLIIAIRNDPYGEIAEKTKMLCEMPLYGAPVFRRLIAAARSSSTASAGRQDHTTAERPEGPTSQEITEMDRAQRFPIRRFTSLDAMKRADVAAIRKADDPTE